MLFFINHVLGLLLFAPKHPKASMSIDKLGTVSSEQWALIVNKLLTNILSKLGLQCSDMYFFKICSFAGSGKERGSWTWPSVCKYRKKRRAYPPLSNRRRWWIQIREQEASLSEVSNYNRWGHCEPPQWQWGRGRGFLVRGSEVP